ncbi:hypothetical protein L596_026882 [Steinernema carpocapsae]|uniref:Uncharacterized protein n=1 Tax=Steinernema carpocapsae TaxID=34508 RepID=A0A4U5M2T9_STECR|nr:hypothetical protein L596_026882 [Steinernema carpocapsae]
MTKPYSYLVQQIGAYITLASYVSALIIYTLITTHFIQLRLKTGDHVHFKKEGHILLYAIIHFVIKFTLEIVFNYAHLPDIPMVDYPLFVGYVFQNLIVSPLLYLLLNGKLRNDFFMWKNKSKVAAAFTTVVVRERSIIGRLIGRKSSVKVGCFSSCVISCQPLFTIAITLKLRA